MKSTEEIIARLRNYNECRDGDIDEAADRLEELIRWIPITERLPDHDIPVLFCCRINGEFGFVDCGWYAGNKTEGDAIAMETSVCSGDWLPCTHWRPLPEVPEVTE
jgi:hypothetical protein